MNIIELKLKINWHYFKNLWLRITQGVGCCDISGLDYYLAKKIIKPLKIFKSRLTSHPSEITAEEWNKILNKIIWSFEYLIDGEENGKMYEKENGKEFDMEKSKKWADKQQEGFELFGKYFRSLWI